MPKIKKGKSPYGIFTEKKMDMKRDFQVDYWQEPIVEKKTKCDLSDLNITCQK